MATPLPADPIFPSSKPPPFTFPFVLSHFGTKPSTVVGTLTGFFYGLGYPIAFLLGFPGIILTFPIGMGRRWAPRVSWWPPCLFKREPHILAKIAITQLLDWVCVFKRYFSDFLF